MNRIEVESSHLKSIGYNHMAKTLEIEFQDGNIYQYVGVGTYTYNKLMKAESKGKYYNRYIKGNKNYTGTKITEHRRAATIADVYWIISRSSGHVVEERNTEEAAWSRAEVMVRVNNSEYFVVRALGKVTPPPAKPAPVRVTF